MEAATFILTLMGINLRGDWFGNHLDNSTVRETRSTAYSAPSLGALVTKVDAANIQKVHPALQ